MELYEKIVNSHPSLKRGQVWCRTCGSTKKVDPSHALRNGWPKCCGYTMTIDHPDEQEFKNKVSDNLTTVSLTSQTEKNPKI